MPRLLVRGRDGDGRYIQMERDVPEFSAPGMKFFHIQVLSVDRVLSEPFALSKKCLGTSGGHIAYFQRLLVGTTRVCT